MGWLILSEVLMFIVPLFYGLNTSAYNTPPYVFQWTQVLCILWWRIIFGTGERLFTSVNFHVVIPVPFIGEALSTLGTGKGLLPCVNS